MGKKSKNYHKEQKEKKQKVKSYGSFRELALSGESVGNLNRKEQDDKKKQKKTDIKGGKLLSDNFINPYIFLPIDEQSPDRDKDNTGNLSGVIECSLDVKSPVFIPNTGKKFKYINGDVGEHHFSEFFSYEDLSGREDTVPIDPPKFPRIPGSELRGVIRNIYEQLTNSCFSVIDQKNLTNMRTGKPKKAALWDMATNDVYKAERVMLNTRGRSTKGKAIKTTTYNSGDKIYIKKSSNTYRTGRGYNTGFYVADDISTTPKPGYQDGCVLIGESFPRKHHDSVFIPLKTPIFSMDDKDISRFENVLKKYNGIKEDESLNSGCSIYKSYINYYLKCKKSKTGLVPIFYSEVTGAGGSKVHYVSPAMITREYFSNTISGILEKNSKHQPCDGSNGWCPACRLFGMVGQNNREDKTKKEKALASRLRFTDSDIIKGAQFASPGILPILGSPRISSSEFYLKRPKGNPVFWNYDYYYDSDKNTKLYDPILKGRKVYWLGKSMALDPQMTEEIYDREGNLRVTVATSNLKQRTAVRSLKKGKTTFKVFFEDLTEEELACLLFCLHLKDFKTEDEDQVYHRIGRGKPYGMGAVEIQVDKLSFHTYELLDGEIKRSSDEKEKEDLAEYNLGKYGEKYKTAKERIQFYSKKLDDGEAEMVDYPKAKDKKGNITIYEWFVQNRGSINRPEIRQCLPEFDNLMKGKRKKRLSTYRKG